MAALVANAPFLVSLSRNKEWIFLLTAVMLAVSFSLTYRKTRWGRECGPGFACEIPQGSGKKIRAFLWVSLASFILALLLSYLLVPLLDLFGAS